MRMGTRAAACALVAFVVAFSARAGGEAAEQRSDPRINDRLELRYTLEVEVDGGWQPASATRGFESGERFKLRVRPTQDTWLYLFVSSADGGFVLIPPGAPGPVPGNDDVDLPAETVLRLDEEPGVERLYLLASTERMFRVEGLLRDVGRDERAVVSEAWLIDLRDEHARNGEVTRQVLNEAVRVDYRQRGRGAAVVVETITIRHYRAPAE